MQPRLAAHEEHHLPGLKQNQRVRAVVQFLDTVWYNEENCSFRLEKPSSQFPARKPLGKLLNLSNPRFPHNKMETKIPTSRNMRKSESVHKVAGTVPSKWGSVLIAPFLLLLFQNTRCHEDLSLACLSCLEKRSPSLLFHVFLQELHLNLW